MGIVKNESEADSIEIEKYSQRKRVYHKLILALVSVMAVFVLMGAGQLKKYMAVDLLGNVTSYDSSSDGKEGWFAIQAYGKKNVPPVSDKVSLIREIWE